jgi:hypothetical protein
MKWLYINMLVININMACQGLAPQRARAPEGQCVLPKGTARFPYSPDGTPPGPVVRLAVQTVGVQTGSAVPARVRRWSGPK